MSKRVVLSLPGRWSENLHGIGRKIELYQRLLKRGDERAPIFSEKIANLARNANHLALKLILFERAEQ